MHRTPHHIQLIIICSTFYANLNVYKPIGRSGMPSSPIKREVSREASIKSMGQQSIPENRNEEPSEELITETILNPVSASPPGSPHSGLHHRTPSITS